MVPITGCQTPVSGSKKPAEDGTLILLTASMLLPLHLSICLLCHLAVFHNSNVFSSSNPLLTQLDCHPVSCYWNNPKLSCSSSQVYGRNQSAEDMLSFSVLSKSKGFLSRPFFLLSKLMVAEKVKVFLFVGVLGH
jgi:hypothetical protein